MSLLIIFSSHFASGSSPGLGPCGGLIGFAPLSPLREWNFNNGGIAEPEHQDTNDKEAIDAAHAEFIVQIIWLDHVDFTFVTGFLGLVFRSDNPCLDGASAGIFADDAVARFGNPQPANELDLESRFKG